MSFAPHDIKYFLEAVREQHFGRAAQAAGVAQPAITKAVRRLEDATGVALFERGAGGVRLTPEGQLFLEVARRFDLQHAELERMGAELRARHAGLLRIGTTNPDGANPAVAVLSEMLRRRPGLRVVLSHATSDRLNDAVERGDLDVAVAPIYPGIEFSCAQLPVGEDVVRVAARTQHPLFAKAALALADLASCAWVMPSRQSASRRLMSQILEQAGLPSPRVAMEAEYMSNAVLGILASTDLLGAVPASMLDAWSGRLKAIPLPRLEFRRSLVLLTRADTRWSPLMIEFRDSLVKRG